MKTKEEILQEVFGHAYGTLHPLLHIAPFHRAMDEYAKKLAVEYSAWIDENGYTQVSDNRWESYSDMGGKTTDELFTEFLIRKTIA